MIKNWCQAKQTSMICMLLETGNIPDQCFWSEKKEYYYLKFMAEQPEQHTTSQKYYVGKMAISNPHK